MALYVKMPLHLFGLVLLDSCEHVVPARLRTFLCVVADYVRKNAESMYRVFRTN